MSRSAKPEVSRHLEKLATALFPLEEERADFLRSMTASSAQTPAVLRLSDDTLSLAALPPLPWQPAFVARLGEGQQAGRHPLHDAGGIYCLDMASVFMALPFLSLDLALELVVDACAAPGGKSLLAWRAFRPSLLISNEAIGKRIPALISNLKRCHARPVMVTGSDTSFLAQALERAADLVIVDAPCSGQALLAKGEKAEGAFHPATVNKCAMRQRRILANTATLVRGGGYLAYMTCTFSKEENEEVVSWFLAKNADFMPVSTAALKEYQSGYCAFPAYRLFPHRGEGAGAFTCLLRRHEDAGAAEANLDSLRVAWRQD